VLGVIALEYVYIIIDINIIVNKNFNKNKDILSKKEGVKVIKGQVISVVIRYKKPPL